MKTVSLFTAIGTILSVAVATTPVASADVTVPVGPEQVFHGLINGLHPNALIRVVCDGPGFGHPRAGQTISVAQGTPPSGASGYTGSTGTSIEVTFFPSGPRPQTFVFTTYDTPQELPATMAVPCGGSTILRFEAQPHSDDAVDDGVMVNFTS